jgi:hypothetical protein
MYVWWYIVGIVVSVVLYVVVVALPERRHWKKRLELIQRRIREREERQSEETQ